MPRKLKLRTIPNVPILQTGVEYELQSGPYTFTPEDITGILSSLHDPAVKEPRLKLGHVGKHGESGHAIGQPVFGKFTNLRADKDGHLLVGDMVGVPEWLAEILPFTYPNRSIEGETDWTSHTGKRHRVVVPAVSLLGIEFPGVSTLEDLKVLYEEGPEALGTDLVVDGQVVARYRKEDEPLTTTKRRRKTKVKARSLQASDVHQLFYTEFASGERENWWCHELYLDPAEIIAEDEGTGRMYRIPFELDGEAVKFGDPVAVHKTYQPVEADEAEDAKPALLYASRAESQPKEENEGEEEKEPKNVNEGGSSVDPKVLRKSLGLPEDATDEQVGARIAELSKKEQEEGKEKEPPKLEIPEGMILVDKEQYDTSLTAAKRGEAAWQRQQREDRDRLIASAVQEGKFPPSRTDHYRKLYNTDPQGAKQLIASLAPGLIPVKERGTSVSAAEGGPDDDSYPKHWLPEVQSRAAAAVTEEA